MSRKRTKITTDDAALSSNPFAAALGGIGGVDAGPAPPDDLPQEQPAVAPSSAGVDLGRRAVVRRQSKGQGGKTVTVVEGIPTTTARAWLPQLKKDLGCGGRIEEGVLVLGTRNHARVATWLESAGVPRVTLGN